MVNEVILIGRLCKDIELKYTPSGLAISENTLAINTKTKDKQKTIFVKIVSFGKGAEILQQYAKKGDKVCVVGSLDYNEWVDNKGVKHFQNSVNVEKVELLSTSNNTQQPQASQKDKPAQKRQVQDLISIDDDTYGDEIPF